MNPDLWKRVSAALDEAASLPTRQAALFLKKLQDSDPNVASEVISLLQQDDDSRLEALPASLWRELLHKVDSPLAKTASHDRPTRPQSEDESLPMDAPRLDDPIRAEAPARAERQVATNVQLERVGDYQLLGEIARGGMGVVYKAIQLRLNRLVAVNMVLPSRLESPEIRRRFSSEAKTVSRLHHPGIVAIYDVGEHQGRPFYSMELVEGISLREWINKATPTAQEATRWLRQLAEIVHAAHEQGVIHRDLKPSNILMLQTGDPERPDFKITDFGLAKILDAQQDLTQTGEFLGTPAYLAPEQILGQRCEHGIASDVYSLGVILYELLTGRTPFRGERSWELVDAVLRREPVEPRLLNPQLARDLETICLKCLAKQPLARYRSCQELADDLGRFQRGESIQARPIGPLHRAVRWCCRKPLAVTVVAFAMLLAMLAIVGLSYRNAMVKARLLAEQNAKLADTQNYYSLVNKARATIAERLPGWSWTALAELQAASRLNVDGVDRTELPSLAATCLGEYDIRPMKELARGIYGQALTFSADGHWLAIGQSNGSPFCPIFVHDMDRLDEPPQELRIPVAEPKDSVNDGLRGLAMSEDGRWIACGTKFGRVFLLDRQQDSASPRQLSPDFSAEVRRIEFAGDGALIASNKKHEIRVWPGPEMEPITLDGAYLDFAVDSAKCRLALCTRDRQLSLVELDVIQPGSSTQALVTQGLVPLPEKAGTDGAGNLAFSADDRCLAVRAGSGRAVYLMDVLERRIIKRVATEDKTGQGLAHSVAINHDGSLLLTNTFADETVCLWDTVSETQIAAFQVPVRKAPRIAFSPRPGWFAVAEQEKVTLHQHRGASVRRALAVSPGVIGDVQFSPDSQRIATMVASLSGIMCSTVEQWELDRDESRRWQAKDYEIIPSRSNLRGAFLAYGPSPANRLVASSNFPGAVVWKDGYVEAPFSAGPPARMAQQSEFVGRQFQVVADPNAGDGAVAVLGPGSEVALDRREYKREGATDWQLFAVLKTNSPGVRTFRRDQTGKRHTELIHDGNYHLHWMGATHHKHQLEIAGPSNARVYLDSILLFPFTVLNQRTGQLQADTPLLHGPFAFSPNGKKLWGVFNENTVVGANVPGFEVTVKLTNLTEPEWASPIYALAAGDEFVLLGLRSGEVVVIEATSGKEVSRWQATESPIRSVVIDRRESIALVGAADGYAAVHRLPEGQLLQPLEGHSQAVPSVALSRDGQQVFLASGRYVHVWRREGDRFQQRFNLQSSSGRVERIRLSHDNRYLAVCIHNENAVRLWDLRRLSEEFAEKLTKTKRPNR